MSVLVSTVVMATASLGTYQLDGDAGLDRVHARSQGRAGRRYPRRPTRSDNRALERPRSRQRHARVLRRLARRRRGRVRARDLRSDATVASAGHAPPSGRGVEQTDLRARDQAHRSGLRDRRRGAGHAGVGTRRPGARGHHRGQWAPASDGTGAAAWNSGSWSRPRLIARVLSVDGTWGRPVSLPGVDLRIVAAPGGRLTAAWVSKTRRQDKLHVGLLAQAPA